MKGNGSTNLSDIQKLISSAMEAVVDFDGRIDLDEVVKLLEKELTPAIIQNIIEKSGKENLAEVVLMFVQ